MDLMRTLLIYMSATMALAVQNTTAPKETPVPTPAPGAIVETAAPTKQGDLFTPAPVPTITPNMKAYHNLTMGAKGKDVKKLQEKLIELGYLPDGSADGAYGRKTYNAVKKFQHYNGLTADGIAGRRTQTYLFENPDIVYNPEATTAPEATPAPETETTAPAEPEILSTPAPEAAEPETETASLEDAETETPAPEAETPAEAEMPAETAAEVPEEEAPKAGTAGTAAPEADAEPEDADVEVVENVDLDAEDYELIAASVALNEGNGPLEYVVTKDGVPETVRPRVSRNDTKIRVSLDDLCECVEKWQLTDDKTGSVVLEAAGYTLALYNEDKGCSATLDGTAIPMQEDDFDFSTDGHYINVEFLAAALKGSAAWDEEESTLMLRIRDKDAVESED